MDNQFMAKIIFTILILFGTTFPQVAYVQYDTPPEPVGGYNAVYKALEYPVEAIALGLEGTVEVQCTIDTLGRVQEINILRGNQIFYDAAISGVEKIVWEPAQAMGRPVPVRITIPIVFRASERTKNSVEWESKYPVTANDKVSIHPSSEKYKLIGTIALLGGLYFLTSVQNDC